MLASARDIFKIEAVWGVFAAKGRRGMEVPRGVCAVEGGLGGGSSQWRDGR